MKFPRLKNALLCRILVYVVVLGVFIVPMAVVMSLSFIPEAVKLIVIIGLSVGFIIYLFKNFVLLILIDSRLAILRCYKTARKRFVLPKSFSVQKTEKKISRFGKKYEPIAISPRPETLQYKSNAPITVYSSGIEKVIATYHVELLDENQYDLIVNSAKANASFLKGKKKHRFIDKTQKKSPLNQVTVIVIYAERVDDKLRNRLYDIVCKNAGDGFDTSVLPCVVDSEKGTCIFDSLRIPYIGYQYPAKNRGIRIIRKKLFDGKFTLADSHDTLDPIDDIDPEQSLWSFWISAEKELISNEKKEKKRFEKMKHNEFILDDGFIYLKWEDRGICVSFELNEELMKAEIDAVDFWAYPKSYRIKKDTVKEIKSLLNTYFKELGYTAEYYSRE